MAVDSLKKNRITLECEIWREYNTQQIFSQGSSPYDKTG